MTAALRVRPRVEGDWLFVPAPQPHRPYRLFCFPHAGGDATAYTPLARALAPAAEVWALRPPARGGGSATRCPRASTCWSTPSWRPSPRT